jgi:dTDP-glucose 4,6-dehydratase
MRVYVSGAGGFAGAHFLEHTLAQTDAEVVATDSFRHKGKTDRITQVLNTRQYAFSNDDMWRDRVSVVTHDLTVPFSDQAAAAMGRIDYMVCYASGSHVDRSISDPVPFVQNNINVALSQLELARKLKPKALVWVSTDEVCGPVEAGDLTGHSEWGALLPSNPYAGSKGAQEALATAWWRTYGVPVIVVRCMNMIGERQDAEKFVPMTIAKVLAGDTVTIHGTPCDIGTRHYLHSRNLADGIWFVLDHTAPSMFPAHASDTNPVSDRPDMYNIATPDRIDNLTLAQRIADDLGLPLNYRLEDFHSQRPGHDPHYGLNPQKILDLGWKPPVPLRESLRKTVEWTAAHQEWLQ